MKQIVISVAIVVALSFVVTPFALASDAQQRIGIVNLSKIFDEYKRTQEADADLEVEGQTRQKAREKTVSEIRRLKDELELLAESKREEKQKAVDSKIRDLQAFDRTAREELRGQRDDLVRDILSEIHKVIDTYGKSKGYDMVLNNRVLLYSNGTNDITNEIIVLLNEKYTSNNQ